MNGEYGKVKFEWSMKMAGEWDKKPCSNMDVSKVEHGYILSILITLINQVLNAGFFPMIAVIPTL